MMPLGFGYRGGDGDLWASIDRVLGVVVCHRHLVGVGEKGTFAN
jgi:hypothetical protein